MQGGRDEAGRGGGLDWARESVGMMEDSPASKLTVTS
jgi:hypothetical protein